MTVTVIGGGVMGLCIATELTGRGIPGCRFTSCRAAAASSCWAPRCWQATGGARPRCAVLELLSAAFALHPAFAQAEVLELGADARPALPDNLPRIRRVGGVIHANGLYRHGFLLAPALPSPAWWPITFNTRPDRSSWMRITINGTARDTAAAPLAETLTEANLTGRIANALNGSFVPATLRETTRLRDGDAIEPLAPHAGGLRRCRSSMAPPSTAR